MHRNVNLFLESFNGEITKSLLLKKLSMSVTYGKVGLGAGYGTWDAWSQEKLRGKKQPRFLAIYFLSSYLSISFCIFWKPISELSGFRQASAWVKHLKSQAKANFSAPHPAQTIGTSIKCSMLGKGLSLPWLKETLLRSPASQQPPTPVKIGKRL